MFFFPSQNATNISKNTWTREKNDTDACHSLQIDICKKYRIYDNIYIQAQYKLKNNVVRAN